MFTMSGYLVSGLSPTGFVRNASTSNLLSFETNVNDSTSPSVLPPRSDAFRSVTFRPFTYNCAVSDGVANEYASVLFLPRENPEIDPESPTIRSAGHDVAPPHATGIRNR